MLRIVLDTVVYVRSLMNPTGLWGSLVFERAGSYRLIVSEPVAVEVLDVIRRPALVRKYLRLGTRNADKVRALVAGAELVEVVDIPPISRDPNDDKFLATALAANADYLVTEDNDLLVLGAYQSVQIVDALTFLRLLESNHPEP